MAFRGLHGSHRKVEADKIVIAVVVAACVLAAGVVALLSWNESRATELPTVEPSSPANAASGASSGDSSASADATAFSDSQEISDVAAPDGKKDAGPAFRYTDHIQVVEQYPTYPSGCEIAALTCVLDSMGYDVTLSQMVEGRYVSYDASWSGSASSAYFGSPYGQGGAFPPAIVAAANRYLEEQGAREQARELQGLTAEELLELVSEGYPVLVWTTVSFSDPAFSGEVIDGYRWYVNEHCVVLYGLDASADEVLVSDSISGLVRISTARFFELYEECGALAMVIR